MPYKKGQKKVGGNDLQSRDIQPKQSEVVIDQKEPRVVHDDEKFEVEIREVVRIKPQDFRALKDSFEEWRNLWES